MSVDSYPRTDHFDGRVFHNVDPTARTRPFSEVWKWYRARTPSVWPRWITNGTPHPVPNAPSAGVAVTWIGHSTFLLRIPGTTILTDPVFSLHAGPFGRIGPRRVRAPALSLHELPRIDLILQSHNHYDHLDPAAHRFLADRDAPATVTPLGNRDYLPSRSRGRATERDWWGSAEPSAGVRVTVVPAQHFSARTPWDRDRALWGGFVLEAHGRTIYFAGDSGYGVHFAEIGRRFPAIDLGLIPIGAYEPRWFMGPVHIDPAEAVRAHLDVGARKSIAMHFGTFQLTDEGINAPAEELTVARAAAGLPPESFQVPDLGLPRLIP